MWKHSESSVRPAELDTTSDINVVYVRKDIEEKTRTDEHGTTYTYFSYLEQTIPKADWGIYEKTIAQGEQIDEMDSTISDILEKILGE